MNGSKLQLAGETPVRTKPVDFLEADSGAAERYLSRYRRRAAVLLSLVLCVLIGFVFDVVSGPGNYGLGQIFTALISPETSPSPLRVILWDIRLPTALLAILVGAMLSAAGTEMQTILNNPLADPFTLGLSSAASFGAALAIIYAEPLVPILGTSVVMGSAFLFSLITAFLLYGLMRLRGVTSETMVLFGIALLFTFNALLGLLQFTATDVQLSQIVFWIMGSLGTASWEKIGICGVVLLAVVILFWRRSWSLTALRMGDEKAASLGVDVRGLRVEMLIGISLLAATAVSCVGTIAFVGLVGPHVARLLIGEEQRFFLPASMLSGAAMMSLSSCISKSIVSGVVFPIGIVTSLIGVPFFVTLVLISRRRGAS